jgi:hypothetical protein
MSCSFDLKEYVLGESAAEDRRAVEAHAAACGECRAEILRLRMTQDALLAVRDEEVPRRIAFVSDQVLAPGLWRRFWNSGPQLGFAAAALLAAAILGHGVLSRPAAAPPAADAAAVRAEVDRQVAAKLDPAVAQAVAAALAASEKRTAELLAAAEKRYEFDRRADQLAAAANLEILQKQMANLYAVNTGIRRLE